MHKIHFLWLCWGPVLFGFALGWLVKHPDDWTGPAVILPLSFVYGVVTYRLAWRWAKRDDPSPNRNALLIAMIASPLVGLILAGMLAFGILD